MGLSQRAAEAGLSDDARALIEAAELAAPRDAWAAAHLLSRALDLLPPDAGLRSEVVSELLPLACWGGRPRLAEGLARSALESEQGARRIELEMRLAESLALQDRWSDAAQAWERLRADPDVPESLRTRVLAQHASSLAFLRRIDEATSLAAEVLKADDADAHARYLALQASSACLFFQGRTADAIERAREMVTLAESEGDVELRRRNPYLVLGIFLCMAGELEEAFESLTRASELSRSLGALWSTSAYQWFIAYLFFRQGRWDEAVEECQKGLSTSAGWEPGWERGTSLGFLACVEARRGSFENAVKYLKRFDELEDLNPGDRAWGELARGLIAEGRGDRPGGYASVLSIWREGADLSVFQTLIGITPDLLRLALDATDTETARQVVDRLESLEAGDPSSQMVRASAAFARGVVGLVPEELEVAAAIYSERHVPHAALAYEELAVARAELNQPRKALAALREALGRFEAMGATGDIRRARARLRWREVIAPPPTVEAAGQGKWATLTKTERTVALLVAEGLRNREVAARLFVSVETVQTHLKNIFKKFGATSRSQVILEVIRHRDEEGAFELEADRT